jgi:hypothetical protein
VERRKRQRAPNEGQRPTVEVFVDYAAPSDHGGAWFEALLWTTGSDPRLVESQHFSSAGDLRVWLKAVAVEHGQANISVRWTDKLKANRPLCHLLGVCLGVVVP